MLKETKFKNFSKTQIIIFSLFFITLFGYQPTSEGKESRSNGYRQKENLVMNKDSGTKAPDFILKSTGGKRIKLSDYKGKIVILDFWATWCPPCRKGIPDLINIQKTYKKNLVVIGISLDTGTKSDVIPFMKKYGINYNVVYADNEVVQNYGNIQAIPTSFIIDKKGNIVTSFVGLQEKEAFVNEINKLLKKP